MKNFTNNFKQFTSRLSARWLIMALMLLLGTSSAWAKKFYLNPTWGTGQYDTWVATGNWFSAWVWGNNLDGAWYKATKGDKYYEIDVPETATSAIWLRKKEGQSLEDWGCQNRTSDIDLSSNNLTNITGWTDNEYCTFTTSSYNPCTSPDVPTLSADKTDLVAPDKATLTVGNTTSGLTYKLYDGATEVASKVSTGSDLTFEVDEAGNYTVSVTNDCGSTSTSTPAVEITVCTPKTNNEFKHANSSYAQLASQPTYYPGDKAYFVSTINCCLTGTWSNNLQKGEESWYTGLKGVTPQFYMTLTRAGNFTITNMATNGCTQDKNVKVNLDFTVTALPEVTNANGTASSSSIALTWNNSANHNNVLVVRYLSTATETIPAGGETYSAGNTLGEGTVVYVGPDENYTDSNLSDGVSYKYYFYTVNNNYYSSGVSIEVTTCTNPNFAIQASETVAKGGQITASITGEHTPLVTWSSSNEEVATIDASGNITAIKFGQTTITATTTGEDEYCENVPQSATLTVKETPRVSITGENTICEGLKVTLTAGITDLSDGNVPTINWYKEGEDDIKKTGATYEPESTGRYYVIVTGDYINRTELGKFQFTINENPIIQSTLDNNATNVEICGTGKETTLSVTEGLASYSWGDGNTKTVNATGKYTVTATDGNGCTSNEVEFDVKVLNPTVEFVGDNEQTVCPGATANFEVVLAQGQSVSWKDADGAEVSTSNPFTQIIEGEAGTTYTYKVVISEGSCSSAEGTVTATIPAINLTVGSISGDNEICSGNATTLTLTGMVNGTVEKWLKSTDNNNYSDVSNTTTTLNTGNLTTSTYYKALVSSSVCPNHKEPTEAYLVTVNPLPTISISGNEKAVFYEDVMLTATATDGATVKWYEGGNEEGTGDTYVVTSASDASKIVTAKAFLGGCESAVASHTVNFSAEDCADVTTTKEETVGKIKLLLSKPSWIGSGEKFYCYAWENNTTNTLLGGWPGTELTQKDGNYYYVVVEANNKDIKIILNDNSEQTVDSDVLNANKIYQISATSSKNSDNKYTFNSKTDKGTYKESVTTTVPAPITAPAVKIESVTTTTGLGNINFTGRVVKKGCDDTNEYGFQYSTDRQNWTTVKVGENASAGTPFSDNSVKGLDGTYYIRAYITNDHSTQTSAEKEIRLQTSTDPISNVSIEFVAAPGENNVPSAYCVGSTAYIKATYDGAKYTQFEWKSDQGITLTELGSIPNVFQFTVKGNDNIVLMLRNIYNREGEFFSNEQPLVVNATPEPIAPTISLDKSTLCSNDDEGATISLANTVVGQTYSLFKEIENEDDTKIGDDIVCTEQNKESISFNLKGLDVAGRYYVIAKENVCNRTIGTTSVTLEVVNTTGLSISIEPNTAVVTPWEPVKLKITATEGYQYNVTGLDGMVYTVNGDTYTVKIPLPEGGTRLDTDDNVIFDNINYSISATLITGGDNQCILPATCTITLTPYLEPCTQN